MCGIAAIYAYHSAAPVVDRGEICRIRDHMAARGPDGCGEWFSEEGRVALGHWRLAILDLSNRGAQPMASADGQLVISFNEEIYNYRALRAQLERKGYGFCLHRRKTGFSIPVRDWLTQDIAEAGADRRLRGWAKWVVYNAEWRRNN
jgi:asparagine synthetase B (glutamine-hydrolysing)